MSALVAGRYPDGRAAGAALRAAGAVFVRRLMGGWSLYDAGAWTAHVHDDGSVHYRADDVRALPAETIDAAIARDALVLSSYVGMRMPGRLQ